MDLLRSNKVILGLPCSMCLDSVNVISVWWSMGAEVRKGSGAWTCQETLWQAAFTSVSSGWLWGEARDYFVLGKIITEDLKLPSILAVQRKAFNFPYFHLGDCNLHLQENEGVIFLVSRHLGWFIAALEVVNGNWGSSSFWRQVGPCQGPWVTLRCYYNLSGFLLHSLVFPSSYLPVSCFHFLGRDSEVSRKPLCIAAEGLMHWFLCLDLIADWN